MSLLLYSAFLVAGMALLYFGGSSLVVGAGGIALNLNISPLVVGLTVVAFGTSAPELFVSVLSAVRGQMGISVGNVIGSNVINIALVLGIAGVVRPTVVDRTVVRFDVPVMLLTYVLFALVALQFGATPPWIGGTIRRWEGAVLVAVLVAYVALLYRRSRWGEGPPPLADEIEEEDVRSRPIWLDVVLVLAGAGMLAGGAELLVRGASWLAVNVFGASERFVGIAIVALGTSLPELFTTLVSLAKGEMDISVGNLVGSNIFNSLMVLGTTALILPIRVGQTDFSVDFLFMVGTSLLLMTALWRRRKVTRMAGASLILVYVVYVAYLAATRTV
mgnify:CR=1 FL=1